MRASGGNRDSQDPEVIDQLAKSQTSGEAIAGLYNLWKGRDRKYSLSYFCKRAAIPSTGYLSDVIKGKRILHQKYKGLLPKAFYLEDDQAEFLKTLIERDHAKTTARREEISHRLEVLRKNLRTTVKAIPQGQTKLFFALEVFCVFGLYCNKPTLADLCDYFSGKDRQEIEEALGILTVLKLVEQGEQHWQLLTEQILFGEEEGGISHVEFIEQSLQQAAANLPVWFGDKKRSSFVSSIISVDSKTYEQKLGDLKKTLLQAQSSLESGDADTLIRFNIQVFPLRS